MEWNIKCLQLSCRENQGGDIVMEWNFKDDEKFKKKVTEAFIAGMVMYPLSIIISMGINMIVCIKECTVSPITVSCFLVMMYFLDKE
jgi:hypothetical protein